MVGNRPPYGSVEHQTIRCQSYQYKRSEYLSDPSRASVRGVNKLRQSNSTWRDIQSRKKPIRDLSNICSPDWQEGPIFNHRSERHYSGGHWEEFHFKERRS